MNTPTLEQLQKWFKEHREEVLKDFFTFLSFPSISTDPKYEADSRRTADWLVDYLKGIGLEAELWETPGLPVVFGSDLKAGKDKPTLLIYHHYDVQPVDPLDLWRSDPFKPVIRNNQVYRARRGRQQGAVFLFAHRAQGVFAACPSARLQPEGLHRRGGGVGWARNGCDSEAEGSGVKG